MLGCCKFLCSSIGKKIVLSFSGMALSLFLLMHLAGNLIVLANTAKFNEYAFNLESLGMLLYAAEAGLIAIFVLHIVLAVKLSIENKAARPEGYYMNKSSGRSRRTWGSSHMLITGSAILVFVIYHLNHFKFGTSEVISIHGLPARDLAGTVIHEFKETDEVVIYLVALFLLFLHLRHGFRSVFDTLGLANSKFDSFFRMISTAYVYGVMGGFALIPLFIYFGVKI